MASFHARPLSPPAAPGCCARAPPPSHESAHDHRTASPARGRSDATAVSAAPSEGSSRVRASPRSARRSPDCRARASACPRSPARRRARPATLARAWISGWSARRRSAGHDDEDAAWFGHGRIMAAAAPGTRQAPRFSITRRNAWHTPAQAGILRHRPPSIFPPPSRACACSKWASLDINGSVRELFSACDYTGVDLQLGPVWICLPGPAGRVPDRPFRHRDLGRVPGAQPPLARDGGQHAAPSAPRRPRADQLRDDGAQGARHLAHQP